MYMRNIKRSRMEEGLMQWTADYTYVVLINWLVIGHISIPLFCWLIFILAHLCLLQCRNFISGLRIIFYWFILVGSGYSCVFLPQLSSGVKQGKTFYHKYHWCFLFWYHQLKAKKYILIFPEDGLSRRN